MQPASSGLSVDWRQLLLQIANFLIIFGILSWLVWKPLLKAVDDRRRAVAEGLAAADAQKQAAAAAETERLKLLEQAKKEANELVAQTRDQLKAEREAFRQELHQEQERLTAQNQKELAGQKAKLEDELKGSVRDLIVLAVGRVAGQLGDTQRVEVLVDEAIKEAR